MPAGLAAVHAGADVVCDVRVEVAVQFLGQVEIPRRRPNRPVRRLNQARICAMAVHSARRATSGSTAAARRAGSQQASSATLIKVTVAAAKTPGSRELTP